MPQAAARESTTKRPRSGGYRSPPDWHKVSLRTLLEEIGRPALEPKQMGLLGGGASDGGDVSLYYAGDLKLLHRPSVSIVGTREASAEGLARASRLARELVSAGYLVVSGLAKGIDTAAHTSAIQHGGSTAAVVGTPLDKAYPAVNGSLQEAIWGDHLLVSPFSFGERTFRGSFPKRNRVMAALSDATVIIEASDTSGTLHQAAECQRLGRWLFVAQSVLENAHLSWPAKFLGKPRTAVLTATQDVLDAILHERA